MVHNGSRRYGAFAAMTHHSPLQTDEISLEIHVSCGVSCKEDRITNAWVEGRAFWNHWVKPEAFRSLLSETALCLYGSRSLACHWDLATSHWPSRHEGFTPSATKLNYQHASTIQIYSGDGGSKPLWNVDYFLRDHTAQRLRRAFILVGLIWNLMVCPAVIFALVSERLVTAFRYL
jgi:hypothetical protein